MKKMYLSVYYYRK